MNDEELMREAVDVCQVGLGKGEAPFGAIIVSRQGQVVARAHNTVHGSHDPTAHAEVNVIRQAALLRQTTDLSGLTLYTTCEPCPMCMAAIHWAGLERVVYAATIDDAANAGLNQIKLDTAEFVRLTGSPVKVEAGPLRSECRSILATWKRGLSR